MKEELRQKIKKGEYIPTWQEVYELPLKLDYGFDTKVWTQSREMAFDFPLKMLYPHAIHVHPHTKKEIINRINGVSQELDTHFPQLTYNKSETTIELDGVMFLIVRGWGNLTGHGVGGLGLDPEVASRLQTEFAEYIIDRLKIQPKVKTYTHEELYAAFDFALGYGYQSGFMHGLEDEQLMDNPEGKAESAELFRLYLEEKQTINKIKDNQS